MSWKISHAKELFNSSSLNTSSLFLIRVWCYEHKICIVFFHNRDYYLWLDHHFYINTQLIKFLLTLFNNHKVLSSKQTFRYFVCLDLLYYSLKSLFLNQCQDNMSNLRPFAMSQSPYIMLHLFHSLLLSLSSRLVSFFSFN